jgi:hypothetical protein
MGRILREALHEAATADLSAAVLYHGLHDGDTPDVCAVLKERDISFVVYSGYSKLEGACSEGELVHKPASPRLLVTTLAGVLRQRPIAN